MIETIRRVGCIGIAVGLLWIGHYERFVEPFLPFHKLMAEDSYEFGVALILAAMALWAAKK